jgi:formiminotetrahydrofolate cyclodeaminase
MSFVNKSCADFVEVLASKEAVPGGGGASALVGAIGMALGNMVGSLTVGKKKYADVEDQIKALMIEATGIQQEFLRLVDRDAEVFEPLSKLYGLSNDDPTKEAKMEAALKDCCMVPIEIMRACAKAIELCDEFAKKGSKLALSDAGVGVVFCKSAMQGASLNVYINTAFMNDKTAAAAFEKESDELLKKYCALADEVYNAVVAKLRKA